MKYSDRILNTPSSFIRDILKVTDAPDVISFAGGLPNPVSFPIGDLQESIEGAIKKNGSKLFQYSTTEGYLPLREMIAAKYRRKFNLDVNPEDVLITNGSQQALELLGKVILNKGSQDGVLPGQPVIDDKGVIGQVTDVYLKTCEVTLLTDKDQAIPVLNVRSGERSVAYGRGQSGYLELRFMMANADIQPDDLLVTSGIDGVYPAGLAVGKVARIRDNSTGSFDHVICEPVAGINRNKQVLVLLSDTAVLPRPTAADRTVNIRQRVNPKAEEPKK